MFRVISLCLALATASGCAYSFGGNVRARGTADRAVHLLDNRQPSERGFRIREAAGGVRASARRELSPTRGAVRMDHEDLRPHHGGIRISAAAAAADRRWADRGVAAA